MNIVAAQSGDLNTIVALLHSVDLPTADLTPDRLKHLCVARENNQVIGLVGLEICGQDALLRSLVVVQAHRGQRLGEALVAAIEELARREGVGALALLTTTAVPFFTRLGYRAIDHSSAPVGLQTTAEFARLCHSHAYVRPRQPA
jgi:amino-acid N-acetyltransferase